MDKKLRKLEEAVQKEWIPEFQLIHSDTVPWTSFDKELKNSKVTLISTGGVYVKGDTPFTDHFGLGDPSYREISLQTDPKNLDHFHEHYDHTNAYKDINCIFPIERLNELVEEGFIGSLSPYHYSFMGYIPISHPLTARTAPELVNKLHMQETDLAILVPT